jgi:hypothetical protein
MARDYDHIKDVHERYLATLLAIKGVVSVGIGRRRRGGNFVDEFGLHVLVETKRPLDEIAEEELIPSEIEGVPVDIEECGGIISIGGTKCVEPDDTTYRYLKGGMKIGSTGKSGEGTLGFMAYKLDDADVRTGEVVMVSNQHVLFETRDVKSIGRFVGHPYASDCCEACDFCDHYQALIKYVPVLSASVDGATAVLLPGTKWYADVLDLGNIVGTYDVTQADADSTTYTVFKRGFKTLKTEGFIRAIDHSASVKDSSGATVRNYWKAIHIEAKSTTCNFADSGDSGSPVLNASNQLVGMVFSVSKGDQRNAFADNIANIISELKIEVATATSPDIEQVIPEAATTSTPVEGSDTEGGSSTTPTGSLQGPSIAATTDSKLRDAILRFRKSLLAHARGIDFLSIFDAHAYELGRLVNKNRAVTVVWRRNKGPQYLGHFLKCLESPGKPLPTQLEGVSFPQFRERMVAVLIKHGSPALRLSLETELPKMIDLSQATNSLEDLIKRLATVA